MELRMVRKQTNIGTIPRNWEIAYLGDVATKVGSGITPTGGEKVYKNDGHPFLRSQNVGWGMLLLDDIAFIDEVTHQTFNGTEVEADDVFLNITGASIGRSAVADIRVVGGNVNQHVCIIRTDQNRVDPRYLNRVLLSEVGQRQIDSFQAGGNRQGLNFGQIRSFRLPVPPIPEQRAIATALSDVDAQLQKLDQLIAKKRDLKQAAMQELLHARRRLPGFDYAWSRRRLGDVLRVRHGKSQRDVQTPNGRFPILATGGEIGRTDTSLYDRPSVLIGRKGTIDSPQYMDLPFWTVDTLFFTEVFDSCIAKFLYYVVKTINWRSYNEASGVPSLNASTIEGIEFLCPEKKEQSAIATVLTNMDAEITALEARRDKTRALSQGMMQALLTGRIRLV